LTYSVTYFFSGPDLPHGVVPLPAAVKQLTTRALSLDDNRTVEGEGSSEGPLRARAQAWRGEVIVGKLFRSHFEKYSAV
jgi:hypothetical protein